MGIGIGCRSRNGGYRADGNFDLAGGKANAAEILARGAKAVADLSSIHIRGSLRTLPADNFAMIAPEQDFVAVELWKQFGHSPKWRIDKPGRMAVMDGKCTLLYIKPNNTGMNLTMHRRVHLTRIGCMRWQM